MSDSSPSRPIFSTCSRNLKRETTHLTLRGDLSYNPVPSATPGLVAIAEARASLDGANVTVRGVLPTALTELCGEIVKALHVRTEAKDWEQFEIKRVAGNPEKPILLRGFGLPDRGGVQYARLVVTLEELARRQQLNTDQAKEKFQLTNREQSVVEHLAKGWTNKEIANALQITEQTVKEHIKHIMRKTNSTTRTGILVHIFNS